MFSVLMSRFLVFYRMKLKVYLLCCLVRLYIWKGTMVKFQELFLGRVQMLVLLYTNSDIRLGEVIHLEGNYGKIPVPIFR